MAQKYLFGINGLIVNRQVRGTARSLPLQWLIKAPVNNRQLYREGGVCVCMLPLYTLNCQLSGNSTPPPPLSLSLSLSFSLPFFRNNWYVLIQAKPQTQHKSYEGAVTSDSHRHAHFHAYKHIYRVRLQKPDAQKFTSIKTF